MLKKNIIYEILMMVLSLLVVIIAMIQLSIEVPISINKVLSYIDFIVWLIFVADYALRLIKAKDRKGFILHNKIDLITILPFNSLFRALRIIKIVKVVRLLKLTKGILFLSRFTTKLEVFLKTNNFNHVLGITIFTIFVGAGLMSVVENMSFADSIWWSFVTVTTVGYGDLSPTTNIGRIIASVLMLIGIGFIGMLTGTIATYFLSKKKAGKRTYREDVLQGIKESLNDFDTMSKEDIFIMYQVMLSLKQADDIFEENNKAQ
jgi:voltage-gated potassium channel